MKFKCLIIFSVLFSVSSYANTGGGTGGFIFKNAQFHDGFKMDSIVVDQNYLQEQLAAIPHEDMNALTFSNKVFQQGMAEVYSAAVHRGSMEFTHEVGAAYVVGSEANGKFDEYTFSKRVIQQGMAETTSPVVHERLRELANDIEVGNVVDIEVHANFNDSYEINLYQAY